MHQPQTTIMLAPRAIRAPTPSTCLLRTSRLRPQYRQQQKQSIGFAQMEHNAHNGQRVHHQVRQRPFSTGKGGSRRKQEGEPFHRRLGKALRDTKIRWYPIPAALGIGFLGLAQFYRVNQREKKARREEEENEKSTRRKRIRPNGPWYACHICLYIYIYIFSRYVPFKVLTDTLSTGKSKSCQRSP